MIKFKTKRIEKEFYYNTSIKDRLKDIIYMLALYTELEFRKDITLTELHRTQEEQDSYYKDNDRYREKPWKSVHQYGRGADIRTKNFEQEEIMKMVDFLNHVHYSTKHNTALFHDIGIGEHIHIQVR